MPPTVILPKLNVIPNLMVGSERRSKKDSNRIWNGLKGIEEGFSGGVIHTEDVGWKRRSPEERCDMEDGEMEKEEGIEFEIGVDGDEEQNEKENGNNGARVAT